GQDPGGDVDDAVVGGDPEVREPTDEDHLVDTVERGECREPVRPRGPPRVVTASGQPAPARDLDIEADPLARLVGVAAHLVDGGRQIVDVGDPAADLDAVTGTRCGDVVDLQHLKVIRAPLLPARGLVVRASGDGGGCG